MFEQKNNLSQMFLRGSDSDTEIIPENTLYNRKSLSELHGTEASTTCMIQGMVCMVLYAAYNFTTNRTSEIHTV